MEIRSGRGSVDLSTLALDGNRRQARRRSHTRVAERALSLAAPWRDEQQPNLRVLFPDECGRPDASARDR